LLSAAATLALISASAAHAQTPAPSAQAATPGASLEEIVVTASRRSERVQKSSLAIAVVTGGDLAQAGVTQAKDLSSVLPGVNIAQQGSATEIYIRGVGSEAANALAEGAVAFNVDGVYIARPTAINSAFFDISRIEVLKGPQGTLYGRNASGGAVNLITKNPQIGDFGGDASVEIGTYGLVTLEGALNIPVNEKLALRGAFQYAGHDGYLSDGLDDQDQVGMRAKALLEPDDDLSFLVTFDYAHVGGKGAGQPVYPAIDKNNPWLGPSEPAVNALILSSPLGRFGLLAPIGNDSSQDNTRWGIAVDMEWDLGFATLSFIPAYREAPTNFLTYSPGFAFDDHEADKQLSVEARLSHQTDALKWVAGIYYFNENQNFYANVDQGLVGELNIHTPLINDDSYAAFGEATYTLFDGFRAIAGLRYTHEDKQVTGDEIDPLDLSQSYGFDHSASFNANNWRAGWEFDVLPDSMLYFTASTGFKSGGFYPNAGAAEYQPEKLTAFELGLKNRFLNNQLEANIEAFDWDYSNRQLSHLSLVTSPSGQPLGPVTYGTFNAGSATLQGVDLALKYRLTPNDTILANVEYNHTNYDTFSYVQPFGFASPGSVSCLLGPNVRGSQTIDCSGHPLARAPLWSGSIGYEHVVDLPDGATLTASVHTQLSSSYWLNVDYIPAEKAQGYSRSDLDLVYRPASGDWSLSGYIRNLENAAVYTGSVEQPFVPGLVFATVLPPRTFGGRFEINF
jgi:iron complex outermembrane receptor protein